LDNITAGVREREDANRTRVAGHLDEIQGVVANTLDLLRNKAVGFIEWLDLFGFDMALCVILEYPSGTAKQEADNYDAYDRASKRMRNEPRIELQESDKDEHSDDCESATAKNQKRENAGNGSYDSIERNSNCSDERRVLKILLGNKVMADETACAGPVVEEVLKPHE
jgi:hypothetical protein